MYELRYRQQASATEVVIRNIRGIICPSIAFPAEVAKLADAPDLGSGSERNRGSSPLLGIILTIPSSYEFDIFNVVSVCRN